MPIPCRRINAPPRTRLAVVVLGVLAAAPVQAQIGPVPVQPPLHTAHRPVRHTHRHAAKAGTPAADQAGSTQAATGAGLPGSPAPVPDETEAAPVPRTTEDTEVNPSVMQLHYPNLGNGYLPGSSPQAMDDQRAAKAGGVEMTVPLQQAPAKPLPSPTDPAPPP